MRRVVRTVQKMRHGGYRTGHYTMTDDELRAFIERAFKNRTPTEVYADQAPGDQIAGVGKVDGRWTWWSE